MINYTELSSRISKESLAIQRGIGEKSGMITMSCAMTVSGLIVGYVHSVGHCDSILHDKFDTRVLEESRSVQLKCWIC